MILILSDSNNASVSKVIGFLNSKFILRLNNKLNVSEFKVGGGATLITDKYLDNYVCIWYVRSYLLLSNFEDLDIINFREYNLFLEYLIYKYKGSFIGSYKDFFFQNNLIQLFEAEKAGLEIPKTVISTTFPDFGKSKVVNKIIGNAKSFSTKNYIYTTTGTQFVNKEEFIENGHLNFFQEYIEKEFEIRIFYFLGQFFSMAIFSQKDVKTLIDYRNYNDNKPNRNIPFKLPIEIQKKLRRLMKKLDLNTGSIDMIYSKTGQFVFLEINPCGIFDWLSSNCNYYIEKYIAKALEYGQ